jgi:hypothetical protein
MKSKHIDREVYVQFARKHEINRIGGRGNDDCELVST